MQTFRRPSFNTYRNPKTSDQSPDSSASNQSSPGSLDGEVNFDNHHDLDMKRDTSLNMNSIFRLMGKLDDLDLDIANEAQHETREPLKNISNVSIHDQENIILPRASVKTSSGGTKRRAAATEESPLRQRQNINPNALFSQTKTVTSNTGENRKFVRASRRTAIS